MTDLNADSPYVARFDVTPTRAQFESACQRLEAHLSEFKRCKLDAMSAEALGAEYIRFYEAFQRYEDFSQHEVSGFMRDWWRIDPIEDVDRVRRRANRQRNLALQHLMSLKEAIASHGPAGIEAFRSVFHHGNPELSGLVCDIAIEHFPDEAEPVIEAMLALPGRKGHLSWYKDIFKEALVTIRGYRARRASALSPLLGGLDDSGMAPALATLDKSPAEFPELLFSRFAACVFSGEMSYHQAVRAAWKQVVAEKRLDAVYDEQAEFAEFDPKFRDALSKPIFDFYGGSAYPERLDGFGITYRHPDGSPVSIDQLREALQFVVWHTRNEPFRPAATWQRG